MKKLLLSIFTLFTFFVSNAQTKAPETQTKASEAQAKAPETQTKASEAQTKAPEAQTKASEAQTKAPETQTKTSEAQTKTSETQTKAIKLELGSLVHGGHGNIAYEFSLKKTQSLTISVTFPLYDYSFIPRMYGAEVMYRFYSSRYKFFSYPENIFSSEIRVVPLNTEALGGFYIGPLIGVQTMNFASILDTTNFSATYFTIGAVSGFQLIFDEHFLVDLSTYVKYVTDGNANDLNINAIPVGYLFSVGYVW